MVGVSRIILDYVMHCNMPVLWKVPKKHDCSKHQTIKIGTDWEAYKMAVYTNLKFNCLDGEGWSCIKSFDAQKDDKQATENLHDNYEGISECNKSVA